jgi:hypothetical protein
MALYKKVWFNAGYRDNQKNTENPEAICQEEWSRMVDEVENSSYSFTFLVEHFPFYKQGVTKAYNEKNK